MKVIYTYDTKTLSLNKIKLKSKVLFYTGIFTISAFSFFIGTFFNSETILKNKYRNNPNYNMASKYDLNPEHDMAWKDSTFNEYAIRAEVYLSRPIFEGTPLKADMMALCARNAYDSTGVILPLELALAQAQWESGMGREGKSPTNNPFNIGEGDGKTTKWFNSTFEGTQSYYYYMCRNYLGCKTVEELFVNFVNCSGKRYASEPSYEQTIRNQYYVNKNWINNSLK